MRAPIRLLESTTLPQELALALRAAPTPTPSELHAVGSQVALALGLGSALHRAASLRVVESSSEAGATAAGALQAAPDVLRILVSKAALVVGACVVGGAVVGAGLSGLSVYVLDGSGNPAPVSQEARAAGEGPELGSVTATPSTPIAAAPVAAEAAAAPQQRAPRAAPSETALNATPRVDEPELALLGRARKALATSPSEALALCDLHQHRYDQGLLAQEREVIALDAELRLGRVSAARARAELFRNLYPGSAHRRRIEALLAAAAVTSP